MTIGVSHDPETGTVVLVDQAAQKVYDFARDRARELAADLRSAAAAGGAVLIIATAGDGRQLRLGGEASIARGMADDLDRNADLSEAITSSLRDRSGT